MRNCKTHTAFALGTTILAAILCPARALGQGGTGKGTTTPPLPAKRTNPKRTPPPKTNSSASSTSCSPQSPSRPTGRSHTANLGGGTRLEMIEVPAGRFCMGSANGLDREKPMHQVTINYSFYIGKYEVTQAQWQALMGDNPSSDAGCGKDCPVESVSWNDAHKFIEKLNSKNDGYTYRLPTESEWEYACRAGTRGEFAGDVKEMGWDDSLHPVGQKRPNAWGLADMYGNVWEWCEDWEHDTYDGAPVDGSAWLSEGEQKHRVIRGGGFGGDYSLTDYHSAFREYASPDDRSKDEGFRVVATARA